MISTRDLSLLPNIDRLKALSQSLAMLDAIITPEWESRFYSFNAHWGPDETMASMRDGSGDEYFILFSPAGAAMKGFAHEAPMSPYHSKPPHIWPGVLDSVPAVFASFLTQTAFALEDTTFCIWRTYNDSAWQHGPIQFAEGNDPDGSIDLLMMLDGNPRTYQQWVDSYSDEQPIDLAAVEYIYEQRPLAQDIVSKLNPNLSLQALAADIEEIGYPTTSS